MALLLVTYCPAHSLGCAPPCLTLDMHRLPQLNFMKMRIEGEPRPLAMGTVLYSLRTQLASSMNNLRSLTLDVRQSWVGAAQAWRELGKLTWLIRLVVNFSREVRFALMVVCHAVDVLQHMCNAENAQAYVGLSRTVSHVQVSFVVLMCVYVQDMMLPSLLLPRTCCTLLPLCCGATVNATWLTPGAGNNKDNHDRQCMCGSALCYVV